MAMGVEVGRRRLLAWRAARHGVAGERRIGVEASGLGQGLGQGLGRGVGVVARFGVRSTRSSGLSFAARLPEVAPGLVDEALEAKELVRVYGARGATTLVPAEDLEVLTLGVLPQGEASTRAALPRPFLADLDAAGIAAVDALETVVATIEALLADGPIGRGELATRVTAGIPRTLSPACRGRCPDPHVEDALFRLAGVAGAMCFEGSADRMIRPYAWLGRAARSGRDAARAELTRRYVGGFAPSAPKSFADWAGIGVPDARERLEDLARTDDLVELTVPADSAGSAGSAGSGSSNGVLVARDVEALLATPEPEGSGGSGSVRFLPAYDPYLMARDRSLLLPERAVQRQVWRSIANPGVVLVDGEPVAIWRSGQRRDRVTFDVRPFGTRAVGAEELLAEAGLVVAALGIPRPAEILLTEP